MGIVLWVIGINLAWQAVGHAHEWWSTVAFIIGVALSIEGWVWGDRR
jgi:hypothetical protein